MEQWLPTLTIQMAVRCVHMDALQLGEGFEKKDDVLILMTCHNWTTLFVIDGSDACSTQGVGLRF